MSGRVGVLGASGFVGSAVMAELMREGLDVRPFQAPRARPSGQFNGDFERERNQLARDLRGISTLVSAAGVADASSRDWPQLLGANVASPLLAHASCQLAGVTRFVHVSSAVVQGRIEILNEHAESYPLTPYARSKALAEIRLCAISSPVELTIYRPPSVHSTERRVTRRLATYARSPLAAVAGDGSRPSPQALIQNVAAAIVHLVGAPAPPRFALHPSEGITTGGLLEMLGGKRPRRVPLPVVKGICALGNAASAAIRPLAADVRRAEMLFLGQAQEDGWLHSDGFKAPVGREGWLNLGLVLRADH